MSRSIKFISEELCKLNVENDNDDQYPKKSEHCCAFFMKTGFCKYGSSCRFIHVDGNMVAGDNQEAEDEPKCRYYQSSEGCKYGYQCCFSHHQNEEYAGLSLSSYDDSDEVHQRGHAPFYVPTGYKCSDILNVPVGPTGLPLRPERPVCKYYNHFGLCKYGVGCPDDHPVDFKDVATPL